MRPVVDAGEKLADFIGGDEGALVDRLTCPGRAGFRRARRLRRSFGLRPGRAAGNPVRAALAPSPRLARGQGVRPAPAVVSLQIALHDAGPEKYRDGRP